MLKGIPAFLWQLTYERNAIKKAHGHSFRKVAAVMGRRYNGMAWCRGLFIFKS
jgi:hypothetical protein